MSTGRRSPAGTTRMRILSGGAAGSRVLSSNVIGMLWMAFAVGCFTTVDTFARELASWGYHPFLLAFWRSLFGMMLLVPVLLWQGGLGAFRTRRLGMHGLRGALQTSNSIIIFVAVTMIPLADYTALLLMTPLYATLGAILFFGERAGWRRWSALTFGMCGGLVIIRPGFEVLNLGVVLVSIAAALQAASRLVSKTLIRTDGVVTTTVYVTCLVALFSLPTALLHWDVPDALGMLMLAITGAVGTVGMFAMAEAYRRADVSVIEPTGYVRLLWAALAGFLVFGEVPDMWVWVGGGMIMVAATYIARREQELARVARP